VTENHEESEPYFVAMYISMCMMAYIHSHSLTHDGSLCLDL